MPSPYKLPYLDSSVYIAAIKRENGRVDIAERILRDAKEGKLQIVASTFLIAEVIKPPGATILTADQERLIDGFLDHEFITFVEVDVLIAREARRLARVHGLKAPDAIHLASAIRAGCDQLLRWDKNFCAPDGDYDGIHVCEPHLVGLPEQLPGIERLLSGSGGGSE